MTAHRNRSSKSEDFLEFMASFKNFNKEIVDVASNSSDDEVKIINESEVSPNHRCDLCCQGEFLIDRLLRFGGLINKKYKFVCDKCDKNFVHKSELRKHAAKCVGPVYEESKVVSSVTEKTFKCGTCLKTFKSQGGLTKHMNSQHSGLTHTCEICKKVFTSFKKFNQHHLKHCFDRPAYVCKFCDKRFHTDATLTNHYTKVHKIAKSVFEKSSA